MSKASIICTGICCLLIPFPAHAADRNDQQYRIEQAKAADKWEYAYLTLAAVDVAQTVYCTKKFDSCIESNPLFGKKPKTWVLVSTKLAGAGLQYYLFNEVKKKDPHTALRVAQISVGLQGAVVAWNMKVIF